MTDMQKAITLLKENDYTCVLVKGDTVYTSDKNGISPMMAHIAQNTDLKGFAAADKIVGKAAALLFVYCGISEVYGEIMSEKAFDILESNGIFYTYGQKTEGIINRTGDGPCPMEKTVEAITEPKEAVAALKETVERLRAAAR